MTKHFGATERRRTAKALANLEGRRSTRTHQRKQDSQLLTGTILLVGFLATIGILFHGAANLMHADRDARYQAAPATIWNGIVSRLKQAI